MADFFTQTEKLAQQVGSGTLRGEFTANRIYAVNQHEKGWLSFMGTGQPKQIVNQHGGGGKFVEAPLVERHKEFYEGMAKKVLEGRVVDAMEDAMKEMDKELKERAPIAEVEGGALRNSGNYFVIDNGVVVAEKLSPVPYRDR